jgi:phosphatidylglycerophosphate synthase
LAQEDINRRPIKARSSAWARRSAAALAKAGVTPNAVSVMSAVFAAAGAATLMASSAAWAFLGCAVAIQLRLVCNLLDGMIAVEGGMRSAVGDLYNEFPDRIADSVLIVALGYAAAIPAVGWFAALAAALTAYVRATGGALGLRQDFRGPMAKQHRMAVMTLACVAASIEVPLHQSRYALAAATWIIAVGSVITCVTRTAAIARALRARAR